MNSSKPLKLVAGTVAALAAAAALLILLRPDAKPEAPQARSTPERPAATAAAETPGEVITVTAPEPANELQVAELRWLPNDISVEARKEPSQILKNPELASGNRRLGQVRQVLAKDEAGGYLAPRLSPDGLQLLVTRPGHQGVYVVPVGGGEPVKVADGSAWGAKWTADGKIQVRDTDGNLRTYAPDGTLESVGKRDTSQELAYQQEDTIYVRPEPGAPPVPLTGSEDRYLSLSVSPDGRQVAYVGLTSGLFVAPTDGSREPVFVSQTGNNPTWLPDGSGLLFDVTSDDGHNFTEGDIYHVDPNRGEVSNLTENDSLIGQTPSPGPDGRSVAFEADGAIYIGRLQ